MKNRQKVGDENARRQKAMRRIGEQAKGRTGERAKRRMHISGKAEGNRQKVYY